MNEQIKVLTKNYLDSLRTVWRDKQKERIIEINSSTNWIIFYTGSIKYIRNRHGGQGYYNIDSEELQKLLHEQIKSYHKEDWKEDTFFLEAGDPTTLEDVKPKRLFFVGEDDDWVWSGSAWMAINKKGMGDGFGETYMLIEEADLTMGRDFRKFEHDLNDLLNNSEIKGSAPPQMKQKPENNSNPGENSNNDETNPETPPEEPSENFTGDSISFTINQIVQKASKVFVLTPKSPFTFRGERIDRVVVKGDKIKELFERGQLQEGKIITISGIQLGIESTTFNSYFVGSKLRIVNDLGIDIQIITVYPEVRAKNAELAQMEKSLVDLASELLAAIQKNQAVCQSARKLGLNLPEVSPDSLNYFRENFFADLDEQLPLTDPINQGIIAANQAIQKSKENIKINVTKTCATNLKKLTDYQNKKPTSNSPLDQLKSSAIEAINQILTDKDNLRNIDWSTLANGKYLNWEEDLLELSSENEVVAYRENFLATLKEFLAQQKNEEPRKNHSPIDLSRIDNTPSLSEARNLARRLIWQLFAKYQVEAKDLESQDRDWVNHLAQLNSRSQIKHFVQELEKKFQQKSGRLSPSDPAPSSPFFTWLLIGSFLVVALVLFIGLIRSSQKKVK